MTAQPIALCEPELIDAPISIRLLGSFELANGWRPPRKVGQTLALLALRAGDLVTKESLAEELWGATPPRSMAQTVQTYIFRLRRDGHMVIDTRQSGYSLPLPRMAVDVLRFEHYVDQALALFKAGQLLLAKDTLTAAFSLCRGPVLADVRCGPLLSAIAARVEDRVVSARELSFEIELTMGHHREVLDDLRDAWRRDPTREDTAAMLMTALFRCWRKVDALEVYRQTRHALEEYGLDPGPALEWLQQQVLRGDRALEWQGGVA